MRRPPKAAIDWFKERGYEPEGSWTYRKGWFVGYAKTPHILTISFVTGKLLLEVCARVDGTEIVGNYDP